MRYSDLIAMIGNADETSVWRVGCLERFGLAFDVDPAHAMTLMGFAVKHDRRLAAGDVIFTRPCGAETAFVLPEGAHGGKDLDPPIERNAQADAPRDLTNVRHLTAALRARGIAWSPISCGDKTVPAVLRAGWDCAGTADLPKPTLGERYAYWPDIAFAPDDDPEDFA